VLPDHSSARAAQAGVDAPPAGCVAVIAIKRRVQCKSRLSGVLALPQRLTLVRAMLAQVIAACREATRVSQIAVLSPERDAVPADIAVLADTGNGLNAALAHAHGTLFQLGVREWLVLPADLPGASAADIDAVIAAGRQCGCALAGDTSGSGTNALYLRLVPEFSYRFGAGSLAAHRRAAADLGLNACVLQLPGLAADVDTPADLFQLDTRTWQRQLA
jgi:2-phospho-L-lactate/phosphoenolpyruvate guanylyltransferase